MEHEAGQLMLRELEPDERLLWAGRPGQGLRVRRGDRFMIPFSLMWGGLVIFAVYDAFAEGAPLFSRFWGVPFTLLGLHLIVGRFLWDAWRRRHTFYGVTDRRILIRSGARFRTTTSIDLRTLPGLTLAERVSGAGDVVLDTSDASHVGCGGLVPKGSKIPAMLEFLLDARNVYDIIRRARAASFNAFETGRRPERS